MLGIGLVTRTAAEIRRDVSAARIRDPATQRVGTLEILATWPGVHALLAHRVSHALQRLGVPLLPTVLAAISRALSGIVSHCAAKIADVSVNDDGVGVV